MPLRFNIPSATTDLSGEGLAELQAAARARSQRLGQVESVSENVIAAVSYRRPNYCLLFTNVFYIASAIAILIIGTMVLQEHVDDLKANVFASFATEPTPCSLPTPDAMRLFQAFGKVPDGGLAAATQAPDYDKWISSMRESMCFRTIVGVDDPVFGTAGSCKAADGASGIYADSATYAEELLALSAILEDSTFGPTDTELAAADLSSKLEIFNTRACLTTTNDDGVSPFYHQTRAYGDIKVRAMRAYVTAMPSFHHYEQVRETCWTDSTDDPFTTICKHACHVQAELTRAAADLKFLVRDGATLTAPVSLPEEVGQAGTPLELAKVLYRLMALSVVGHYDRYYNKGMCFKNVDTGNAAYASPLEFCDAVLSSATAFHAEVSNLADPMGEYGSQQQNIHNSYGCTREQAPNPPPPAPPKYHAARATPADINALYDTVCANTLQYGLFEQGRLFGIQDPTGPFVVDNRGDRDPISFLFGKVIYDALYVNKQDAGQFREPKARLELYMGYRLAGTTVWGTLTASLTGYFLWRAVFPSIVFVTRLVGIKGTDGVLIKLMRPDAEYPVWIAVLFALVAAYWMTFVDPATQSHYPRTTDCSDFLGTDSQISTSAYVTTWSKRRFDRNGEQELGILLVVFAAIFGFQQIIGRKCVNPEERRRNISPLASRDLTSAFWIVFLINFVNVIVFAATAGATGGRWYDDAVTPIDTTSMTDLLTRDCIATVYAGFWAGSTVAVVRQRWAVIKLAAGAKLLWAVTAALLSWMPVIQSDVLFEAEWDGYFAGKKAFAGRTSQIVMSIINGTISTLAIVGLLLDEYKMTAPSQKETKGTDTYRDRIARFLKATRSNANRAAADAAALASRYGNLAIAGGGTIQNADDASNIGQFSFKFTDAQLGVGDETGYTTALPPAPLFDGRRRKDQVQYIPMLKFKH